MPAYKRKRGEMRRRPEPGTVIDADALQALAVVCATYDMRVIDLTHIENWPDCDPPRELGATWFADLCRSGDITRVINGERCMSVYLASDGTWKERP